MKKKSAPFSDPALASLVTTVPGVHQGGKVTWSLDEDVLAFIEAQVGEETRTLETGAGTSTLLFAAKRTEHTCITPSADEVARLKAHCQQHGVPFDRVTFIVQPSQHALPSLPERALDLVLIDGSHAFPLPFVDWMYTAPRLRVGGLLVVDDTQLWTGEVLSEFLAAESAWEVEKEFSRTCVFRKVSNEVLTEWTGQPYVFERSYVWRRGRWRKAGSVLRRPRWSIRTVLQALRSRG